MPQPPLESCTAHWPCLAVPIEIEVCPHPAIGSTELVGGSSQVDQNIGLLAVTLQQLFENRSGIIFLIAAADAGEFEYVVPAQLVLFLQLMDFCFRARALMFVVRAHQAEQLTQRLAEFFELVLFHCGTRVKALLMVRLASVSGRPARVAASSSMSRAKSEPPSSRARHAAQNNML